MTLGIVAAIVTLVAALALAAGAVFTVQRAQSVVDDSALAAADSASGRSPGYPCDRATAIAASKSLALVSCEITGHSSRVTSSLLVLGIAVSIRAQAGPSTLG
jgi:DNA topoisomerase-1